jgi:hypothetical protein
MTGRIAIKDEAEMKKRLGHSPDRADAAAVAGAQTGSGAAAPFVAAVPTPGCSGAAWQERIVADEGASEARTSTCTRPAPLAAKKAEQRRLRILACVGPPGLARFLAGRRSEPAERSAPKATACGAPPAGQRDASATCTPDEAAVPPGPEGRWGRLAPMWMCIHEAGHALARWYVGLPFREVSIDLGSQQPPDSSGLLRVATVTGFDFVPPRRTWFALAAAGDAEALVRGRVATEMEMFAAYAGPCAQARYPMRYKDRPTGGAAVQRSRRLDVDILLHAGGGGEADWSLIEADAADWPEGIAMAARARRLADAFVRGRAAWGAIGEVARRLSAELRLGWDDVDAAAARRFGRRSPGRNDWMPHWPPLALAVRGGFLPPGPGEAPVIRCAPRSERGRGRTRADAG